MGIGVPSASAHASVVSAKDGAHTIDNAVKTARSATMTMAKYLTAPRMVFCSYTSRYRPLPRKGCRSAAVAAAVPPLRRLFAGPLRPAAGPEAGFADAIRVGPAVRMPGRARQQLVSCASLRLRPEGVGDRRTLAPAGRSVAMREP